MNKQFDLFVKMKLKELCENISRMTYAYINPETNQPTVVPAKHYREILDQPVEVLVNDQVKRQFLNIMFKQMKALKEEEPVLFNETLLLMDLNKTPDSLELNEEAALKLTAQQLVESSFRIHLRKTSERHWSFRLSCQAVPYSISVPNQGM